MKKNVILLVIILFIMDKTYSQTEIRKNIGETGYYLMIPVEEFHGWLDIVPNFLRRLSTYKEKIGATIDWENDYMKYNSYILQQWWDKDMNVDFEMICFIDAPISNYKKLSVIDTYKIKTLNKDVLFSIYNFKDGWDEYIIAEGILPVKNKYIYMTVWVVATDQDQLVNDLWQFSLLNKED